MKGILHFPCWFSYENIENWQCMWIFVYLPKWNTSGALEFFCRFIIFAQFKCCNFWYRDTCSLLVGQWKVFQSFQQQINNSSHTYDNFSMRCHGAQLSCLDTDFIVVNSIKKINLQQSFFFVIFHHWFY